MKGCYISLPSGCPKQPKWWAATEAKIQAANGWYFEDAVMRKTASACAVRDAQFESWCGVSDADVQWVRRPLSPACPRPAAGRTKQLVFLFITLPTTTSLSHHQGMLAPLSIR